MIRAYINEHAIPADGFLVAVEIHDDQDGSEYESFKTEHEALDRVDEINGLMLKSWDELTGHDKAKKKAYLVDFAPLTRIVTSSKASDEQIAKIAIEKLLNNLPMLREKMVNDYNLEEDLECPFELNGEAVIRNNCGTKFNSDEDLSLLAETLRGKIYFESELTAFSQKERDAMCIEWIKGCPHCKTDGYLADIKGGDNE